MNKWKRSILEVIIATNMVNSEVESRRLVYRNLDVKGDDSCGVFTGNYPNVGAVVGSSSDGEMIDRLGLRNRGGINIDRVGSLSVVPCCRNARGTQVSKPEGGAEG